MDEWMPTLLGGFVRSPIYKRGSSAEYLRQSYKRGHHLDATPCC